MIVAVLLAFAQTAQAVPPPSASDEVVVTAQRLKRLRVVTKKDRKTGVVRCVVKRASGDPALDEGVCDAVLACVPTIKAERDIRPCMEPAMKVLVPNLPWVGTRAR